MRILMVHHKIQLNFRIAMTISVTHHQRMVVHPPPPPPPISSKVSIYAYVCMYAQYWYIVQNQGPGLGKMREGVVWNHQSLLTCHRKRWVESASVKYQISQISYQMLSFHASFKQGSPHTVQKIQPAACQTPIAEALWWGCRNLWVL